MTDSSHSHGRAAGAQVVSQARARALVARHKAPALALERDADLVDPRAHDML